jgi:hypothetical protein
MKSLSGKELAKLLEKNGWQLLRSREATTSLANQTISSDYRCRFMAISLSNEVFSIIFLKWRVLIQRRSND